MRGRRVGGRGGGPPRPRLRAAQATIVAATEARDAWRGCGFGHFAQNHPKLRAGGPDAAAALS